MEFMIKLGLVLTTPHNIYMYIFILFQNSNDMNENTKYFFINYNYVYILFYEILVTFCSFLPHQQF